MNEAASQSKLDALAVRLSGGDRRSIGAADTVAQETVADPGLVPLLLNLMLHADALVRMRAADALEKASRQRPEALAPHVDELLREIGHSGQQEVRWHVAQMIPRLPLGSAQRDVAIALLRVYREDRSRIVVVEALTALAAMARGDPPLRGWLRAELESIADVGPPSVRSRARRLLACLGAEHRASS